MEQSINQPPVQDDDASLKSLIQKIRQWCKLLWARRIMMIIGITLGMALGLTYALVSKPTYTAKLSFVLEESTSNPLGAYVGLASQFGIDLGMGAGNGIFSGDNILEFLRSKLMIEKTLLTPVNVGGQQSSLADLYMKMYDWEKRLQKEPLKGIHFPYDLPRAKYSGQQDSLLNEMYEALLKENLSVSKPDKKLNFVEVKCNTLDERFSKAFAERLVYEATTFYTQTKTQRTTIIVTRLQEKADSIESLLNKTTYDVARTQDMNLNPAKNLASVSTELKTRDKFVLQTIYTEVLKNLEISKMAAAQETPIIQVVDTPLLPIKKVAPGKISSAIGGGIIGAFLVAMLIFTIQAYRKIIS